MHLYSVQCRRHTRGTTVHVTMSYNELNMTEISLIHRTEPNSIEHELLSIPPQTPSPFYGHYSGQPALVLVQSFTARMPLLTAIVYITEIMSVLCIIF